MNEIAIFLAGVAAGLALYRLGLCLALGESHFSMCDVCRYRQGKRQAVERRRPERD